MTQHIADWQMHVYLFEDDGHTSARVELRTPTTVLNGSGQARRNPVDPDVPEIGDEIAVGRALVELGNQLLDTAGRDIAAVGNPRT
ncbi:MAG TPA: DUF1876 domain-containing protein [Mycobacteriales bacterium]|nr:DUF1876 domain-containing protein [Mycobacteriales bacterium]